MKAYFAGYNIITSLGTTVKENVENILQNKSGVKLHNAYGAITEQIQLSEVNKNVIFADFDNDDFTTFEKFLIFSIRKSLIDSKIKISEKTGLILSTTKGNIELLDKEKADKYDIDRINLWKSAEVVSKYFGIKTEPLVISNACISGVQAINAGMRMIQAEQCDNVIVVGGDILSDFVISGFLSFKSISSKPCKPFDKNRDGLSLGEGAATMLITSFPCQASEPKIEFIAGATANDANHISGPSRTGEGLYQAIDTVLQGNTNIDYISAHGTATPYNDNMESIALNRCGLQNVPVNSFKGYFGHTLGAAGLIETALTIYSMQNNILFNTLGFDELGTDEEINVINKNAPQQVNSVLKIASGFGGSNAALYMVKE